jgi:hypothetical protein
MSGNSCRILQHGGESKSIRRAEWPWTLLPGTLIPTARMGSYRTPSGHTFLEGKPLKPEVRMIKTAGSIKRMPVWKRRASWLSAVCSKMTAHPAYIKFCAYMNDVYRVVPFRTLSSKLDYSILCSLLDMLEGPDIPYDCDDASAYYRVISVNVPGWYETYVEPSSNDSKCETYTDEIEMLAPSTPLLIDVRCDNIFQFYEACVCT